MSIQELFAGPMTEGRSDDRLPPQDVAAERSVLGGMLLSKDAIADCVEGLRGVDFYRPAHEGIYDAILDLYGRGEPADPITVADELTKRGDLTRVGGQAYLHELVSSVPTAANAGYYAQIVAERAVLRRLVEAGTRIVQMGYAQNGDVEDIVNAAQAEVYGVADKRGGDDYAILAELLEATMDEIEVASGKSGEMTGVPTGFTDLDTLTNGLHPGQMIVIAARPAIGKALALDTPLVTPGGWTTMGEVQAGDLVVGADGRPAGVVAATEVMQGRPCFEVEFSDGSVIVADAEHQWSVSVDSGVETVVTTRECAALRRAGATVAVERVPGRGPAYARASAYARGSAYARASAYTRAEVWKVTDVRAVPSVPVRCIEVDSPDHLYLAGRSMIPTHNSTLGLDLARSASIKHRMASIVFSLEMSRTEIMMRLLSAEAGVQLQHMRKGLMRDEDWTRLAQTMGRLSDAPLFIDDSPNMSLMEIRAKCRRLKQRNNLKLVIIDYLQLMSSGKRVESRQQEVAEFSRALKLLAKELEVPVIAISQLNRGPEQRTDKKPQMSDLRESGCLTAETRVLRADTGAEMTLGELHASGARDVPVWSLDESLRYVRRHLTHVFPTGTRPVFTLTLASGKQVRATENHPFLSYDGWVALGDLRVGSRVAVPRHVPAPKRLSELEDDGTLRSGARILSSATRDPAPRMTNAQARLAAFGCSIGFDLVPARERRLIPDLYFMPKRQIGLFVDALWRIDGEVVADEAGRSGRVVLRAASRRLLDDVSLMLLRFGISTRIARGVPGGWALSIVGVDDQRRFLQEIYIHGDPGAGAGAAGAAGRLLGIVRERTGAAHGKDAAGTALATATLDGDESGIDLSAVSDVLDGLDLDLEATNDVLWDSVASIVPDGVERVFDATVLGGHNFIANGIAVHNSIEQDADMVILLHREDAYSKESERSGEADLIVAKHRNGPTDTITLAFQGHYSRFTNMAQSF